MDQVMNRPYPERTHGLNTKPQEAPGQAAREMSVLEQAEANVSAAAMLQARIRGLLTTVRGQQPQPVPAEGGSESGGIVGCQRECATYLTRGEQPARGARAAARRDRRGDGERRTRLSVPAFFEGGERAWRSHRSKTGTSGSGSRSANGCVSKCSIATTSRVATAEPCPRTRRSTSIT